MTSIVVIGSINLDIVATADQQHQRRSGGESFCR